MAYYNNIDSVVIDGCRMYFNAATGETVVTFDLFTTVAIENPGSGKLFIRDGKSSISFTATQATALGLTEDIVNDAANECTGGRETAPVSGTTTTTHTVPANASNIYVKNLGETASEATYHNWAFGAATIPLQIIEKTFDGNYVETILDANPDGDVVPNTLFYSYDL